MNDLFISIPFHPEYEPISKTIQAVATRRGLEPVLASDEKRAIPIAEQVRARIQECRILVADISSMNPNVYHEVGIAQASGKSLILLTRERPPDAAFNLRGLGIIQYSPSNLAQLDDDLELALDGTISPNQSLRAFLVPGSLGMPTNQTRYVIAASPLSWRRAIGRAGGYPRLRRTSSDYVGIRGILQGFGVLFGYHALPDLVDPEDCCDQVIEEDMTLYCIASPKANRWTRMLLREYARRWVPLLEFRPDENSTNLRNISVSIFSDGVLLHPAGWDFESKGDRYQRDFGLILRGPNPHRPKRMVTVLAGRSSLGTEAACTALTNPDIHDELRGRFRGSRMDIEDHEHAFWALVSMRRNVGDWS